MTGSFEKFVILCYLGVGISTAAILQLLFFPSNVPILPNNLNVWTQAVLIASFGTFQQFFLVCKLLCDMKWFFTSKLIYLSFQEFVSQKDLYHFRGSKFRNIVTSCNDEKRHNLVQFLRYSISRRWIQFGTSCWSIDNHDNHCCTCQGIQNKRKVSKIEHDIPIL